MRCVTVPGSHSGSSEPIVAFLPGGIENLSHMLASLIREQLKELGHHEPKREGMSPSGAAKSFDVVS
jgi:hypothetical protein